jgi:hypothetical protein
MSNPHESAIARNLATRFTQDLGERLPALTERALDDGLDEETPFRSADPSQVLAFASFLVSLASLTWTVYKDLRAQQSVASDVALLKGMMLERLRAEATPPRALPEPVCVRVLEAAVDETLDEARRAEKR